MSTELVVLKNGGAGSALQLDATQMLAEIREILERKGLMTADQFFMVSGHPVHETSEGSTPLSEVLVTPEGQNHPVLTVGVGSANIGQGPDDTVRMWNLMGDGQKLMILNSIVEITKGIALDANGAHKTTHDAITPLANDSLPSSTVPRIQSSVKTKAYFSKYAQSLATSNTNGASLSVSTPFASGSTSFSYAQSHSQSSSGVNTYFVGSYNVNKVVLELDEKKLQLTNNFRTALLTAAAHDQRADEFVGIVKALNQYGWYIVIKLTLGGLLYTTKTEKASSWSQADSHATEFAASFEASFRGIGGGAAYNHADSSETTSSGSSGETNLVFTAVGGDPAKSNSYPEWANSLEPAAKWNASSYGELIPSLVPLLNMGTDNKRLYVFIKNVLANEYANSPSLHNLQPLIDVGDYSLQLNKYLELA